MLCRSGKVALIVSNYLMLKILYVKFSIIKNNILFHKYINLKIQYIKVAYPLNWLLLCLILHDYFRYAIDSTKIHMNFFPLNISLKY